MKQLMSAGHTQRLGTYAANDLQRAYQARLIGDAELVEHVSMGWEVVRELQNGQVLVRKPS